MQAITEWKAPDVTDPSGPDAVARAVGALFSPVAVRGLALKNRLAVPPMCQYSAVDGMATDWHLVHLGSFAKGGFALVTRMEQFNERTGAPKREELRWKAKPVRDEEFSVSGYIRSLFSTEPGYFRVFVFIVTAEPFNTRNTAVSKDAASAWLDEGLNKLPKAIGDLKYDPANTNVTALIYEFRVKDTNSKGTLSTPSGLEGMQHLRAAKILQSF